MNQIKDLDVSKISFSSTVFPSREDMVLWSNLSGEEQRVLVSRDLDAAEASGVAPPETAEQVIARVRRQS